MSRLSKRALLAAGGGAIGLSLALGGAPVGLQMVGPRQASAEPSPSIAHAKLTAQPQSTTLGGGVQPFQRWTYCEVKDGAALRGIAGQTLKARLDNQLDVPTTLHWHGLRVSKGMDGVTGMFNSPLVDPKQEFTYDVPLRDPGTHWFHSHHDSLNQIARGLYGPLVVENPEEPKLFELMMVLDDWTVSGPDPQNYSIDWTKLKPSLAWGHAGVKGRVLTINGSVRPRLDLAFSGATRLRMLNAATARVFRPSFENLEAWVVALDGYGCTPFRLDDPVFFGPGQRMDVLLVPAPFGTPEIFLGENLFGKGTGFEFSLGVETSLTLAEALPAFRPYQPPELVPEVRPAQRKTLRMSEPYRDDQRGAGILNGQWQAWESLVKDHNYWLFNDVADNSLGPLFAGRVGETIELRMFNDSATHHVMHFHGQHVQIIENAKVPHEVGSFRDSLTLEAWAEVKLALKLDRPGLWPLHCHILGHQVSGMWTYYEVA